MTSLNPVFSVGSQIGEVLKLHEGITGAAAMEEARRDTDEAFALARAVVEKLEARRDEDFLTSPHARLSHIREPSVLADAIAPLLAARIEQKQELLETGDVVSRLERILALMNAVRKTA